MTRFAAVVLLLLVAGCAAAPAPSPASPSRSALTREPDCGSFTVQTGEALPDQAVTCFLDAHLAKRTARLEQTAPSVEGRPIREEYVTDGAGLIAVTIDMSQDPYGGYRIDRMVCSEVVNTTTGRLGFESCTVK